MSYSELTRDSGLCRLPRIQLFSMFGAGEGGIGINAKARELINLRGFRHSRIKKKCHMETENHYKEVLKRSQ